MFRNGKVPHNPWFGISAANSAAQLSELVKNARLQRAINLRTASQVLGVPPAQLEDEMIAGGDITVNAGNGRVWMFASALALAVAVMGAAWLISGRPAPVVPTPAPGPPAPAPAPSSNSDYIEFYRP